MRASERRSHEGLALASPFACCPCVTSRGIPKMKSFLAVYLIAYVYCFACFLFFWTRFWERAIVTEPYFVKRILGSFRAVRNATYTATPKEKTRSVTYTQTRTLPVRDIERVMIFLNPRGGKIKRIMRFDWLPEHLAVSGYPALVLQDKVLVIGLDLLCVLLTST